MDGRDAPVLSRRMRSIQFWWRLGTGRRAGDAAGRRFHGGDAIQAARAGGLLSLSRCWALSYGLPDYLRDAQHHQFHSSHPRLPAQALGGRMAGRRIIEPPPAPQYRAWAGVNHLDGRTRHRHHQHPLLLKRYSGAVRTRTLTIISPPAQTMRATIRTSLTAFLVVYRRHQHISPARNIASYFTFWHTGRRD